MRYFCICIFFVVVAGRSYSQDLLKSPVQVNSTQSLKSFFGQVENEYPVRFFYLDEWIAFSTVDERYNGHELKFVLDEIFSGTDISYVFLFGYAVILSKDPANVIRRDSILQRAVESQVKVDAISIGDIREYVPGKDVVLRGSVQSEVDKGNLHGVSVFVNDLNMATTTDAAGHYQLTLPAGDHVLSFQHLNFAERVIDLRVYRSGTLNIILEERPTLLQEVEVSDQAIVNSRVSQTSLQIKDIKRAPTFLGEVDVIKNLQAQPGVTTVGEVAGGFNVRGGGVDQNLVLYDGTPVFNTSHALGFFSAFNSDAVGLVSFYRGGIPAEFGGRTSSVLNITSKTGDFRKWHGSGGIGIVSSHVMLEGPIKRDTTSLVASFRTSYSNWMLKAVSSNYQDLENSSVAFYDGSLKLTHRFSTKSRITLAGYTSHDQFTLTDDTVYSWNNFTGSVRFDHTHSEKFFSSVSFSAGKYSYQFEEHDPESAFRLHYSILYPSVNVDFNYNGPHTLAFGIHNTYYEFNPGHLEPVNPASTIRRIVMPVEKALESAVYFSDAFYLTDDLLVELGLRYSVFNRVGPGKQYLYHPDFPREPHTTIDSLIYKDGEIMKTYHGAEPRASVRYMINETSSVKAGYNRMYQYLHLITNTAAVTPVDIWQSSNGYFKPQVADQISLGYYRSVKSNNWEFFVEGFYKHVGNILDFKDGADLLLNPKLETALLPGRAKSYGAEVSLTKIKGRLHGFVNYTFSRSLRIVNGSSDSEKINDGKEYPSNYDQPHVANLSWRYGISRRHFFSGNFTYHRGRPMSVPRSSYQIDGVPVADFAYRNSSRIPDYHRLDLAFIIEGNHKLKKFWDGTWIISFYNVYARRNAYSVFYKDDANGRLLPYKLSIIGTIVPSVTYNFKF